MPRWGGLLQNIKQRDKWLLLFSSHWCLSYFLCFSYTNLLALMLVSHPFSGRIEEMDTPPNEARKALLQPAWTEALVLVITSRPLHIEPVNVSSQTCSTDHSIKRTRIAYAECEGKLLRLLLGRIVRRNTINVNDQAFYLLKWWTLIWIILMDMWLLQIRQYAEIELFEQAAL